jgi:hypothetical protein
LYEKYVNKSSIAVVDEWTLSIAMGANLAAEMEDHYKTFIVGALLPILRHVSYCHSILQTEKDFADIAAAGLNWVRIPVGFWVRIVYFPTINYSRSYHRSSKRSMTSHSSSARRGHISSKRRLFGS